MMDDEERMNLAHSVRTLSTNIDAAALEIGSALDAAFAVQLMQMSIRLSNAADMIENPSLAIAAPERPSTPLAEPRPTRTKLLH